MHPPSPAFPHTLIRRAPSGRDDDPASRRQHLRAFLIALWDDLDGYARFSVADIEAHPDGDKVEHRGFEQRYFEYPDDLDRITSFVIMNSVRREVFYCPVLLDACVAKGGHGTNARFGWGDHDAPFEDIAPRLRTDLSPGSLLVASGTGAHFYPALDQPYPATVVTDLNRALVDHFDADHKWHDNSLLRPPGSFNHKPTVRTPAGPPTLVTWERICDPMNTDPTRERAS